jgi:hypothetical protein
MTKIEVKMTDSTTPLSPEEQEKKASEWSRNQYAEVQRYCSKNQFQIKQIIQPESRLLPPLLAVWKVELNDVDVKAIWVIGGEVPTDHVALSVAKTAREAMRHFSMSWQLKATQIEAEAKGNDSKMQYMHTLIRSAEGVYQLASKDELWQA